LQFPSVIGQKAIQQKLMDLVRLNRLSHAILMVGAEGVGTLPLALDFGRYVVSHKAVKPAPVMVADLFGSMSALPAGDETEAKKDAPTEFPGFDSKALDLVHPDLHFSYPVIKRDPSSTTPPISADWAGEWRSFVKENPYGNLFDWLQYIKAENKQGNITAKECYEIMHKLSLKPYESKYKVLVMWMPEMLGPEGNRLLKLIEEPPPDTLFIFAAEKEEKILSTIVSRCQVIRIPPLDANDIVDALVQHHQMDTDKARQIALVSGGSYRDALELLQHHEANWNIILRDWLNSTLMRGSGNPYAVLNKVVTDLSGLGREKQKQLLIYFLQLIEQSLRLKLVGESYLHLPAQEAEFAQRLNKIAGPSTLGALAGLLENATYYIERNANAKLLFHSLSIKMRFLLNEKKQVGITA
jgi:DNA polymerase III subunit delta'